MLITALPGATAATVTWRRQGQLYVTAVVKATFSLIPGSTMMPATPERIIGEEQALELGFGLRSGGDLAPYLGQTDVWLLGHATMSAMRAITAVRFGVFRDGVPLLDSWAGLAPPQEANSETARARIVGLGLIPERSPVRQKLLAGCDPAKLKGPILDIPISLDWRYFQATPPQQQIPHLRGDEWIGLMGVFSEYPSFMSRLPGAYGFAYSCERSKPLRAGRPIPMVADMLQVDVDRRTCSITWRGHLPVRTEEALAWLHIVAGVGSPGRPLAWADPFAGSVKEPGQDPSEWPLETEREDPMGATLELALNHVTKEGPSALPFVALPPGVPSVLQSATQDPPVLLDDEGTGTLVGALKSARSAELPFQTPLPSEVPCVPEMESPTEQGLDATTTVEWGPWNATTGTPSALPFMAPLPGVLPAFQSAIQDPSVPLNDEGTGTLVGALRSAYSAELPFQNSLSSDVPCAPETESPTEQDVDATTTMEWGPWSAATGMPSALPFMAPLPGVPPAFQSATQDPAVLLEDDGTGTLVGAPRAAPSAALPFKITPGLQLLPIESYASIKAQLWGASASSAARVLSEHGLTEAEWLLQEQYYADAIVEELHQEQTPIERALRVAILAAEARCPKDIPDLTIDEFVALRIACETAVDPAMELSARGLTTSAFHRLRSHWRLRSSADPALAAALRARLATCRTAAIL